MPTSVPAFLYHSCIQTRHPKTYVVIIRENEEDLCSGIQHQQTGEVGRCTRMIPQPGPERIVRYAFEYTKACGRKKVPYQGQHLVKRTVGPFYKMFDGIEQEYQLGKEHWIAGIDATKLADAPEPFDVIVVPNLYGDI